MPEPFSIVCVSPQEWHVDLPTNRQQIMVRAARRGHTVLFVETGGFLGRAVWRLLRHRDRAALAGLFRPVEVAPNVLLRRALNVLPWGHTHPFPSAVNGRLTALALRRTVRSLPQPAILWLYDPCAAGLVGSCGERFAVYDCVDDYAEQTGASVLKRQLAESADREAASKASIVFATASPLFERHRKLNSQTHLVPNVGDFQHFAAAADRELAPPELRALPRPVLGFAGNLMASKVDFRLLEALADAYPSATLLLVGPVRPDAQGFLDRVLLRRNVRWVGPKTYAELPSYVAAFDVGLIPYVSNAYTRSCFPLKLYEYLAAGKPVVASGLPELRGREPDVVVAEGDEFIAAVGAARELCSLSDRERRMATAARNTWDVRTERLLALVAQELG